MTLVIASDRPWNNRLAERLQERLGYECVSITSANDLTPEFLSRLSPQFVFFPHWSARIPPSIWSQFECVVFHMTDVPYGRGGSPLQNLIAAGHDTTMLSALRCGEVLDAGPVYLKRSLALHGSAEEIFQRADGVIEEMVVKLLEERPAPQPQSGPVTTFRRRGPKDSDLARVTTLKEWYDQIRMLDAEGYPHAFLDVGPLRLEFRRASLTPDAVEAEVRIVTKPKEPA